MPLFYRGAGLGTHWWQNDACQNGFQARAPRNPLSIDRLKQHIGGSTQTTPFISLSRSFAVACDYAINAGRARPTSRRPAFVYEIEINGSSTCRLLDPIKEIAAALPDPLISPGFHHDGAPSALIGIVDAKQSALLAAPVRYPPPQAPKAGVNVGPELLALVRALRDAEIVAVEIIPPSCVVARHTVW